MNIIKTTTDKSAHPWVDAVLCKQGDVVLKGRVRSSYTPYNIDMGELTLTASFVYDGQLIENLPFARYCVEVDRVHMMTYLFDTYSELIPHLIPVGAFREFLVRELDKVFIDETVPGFVVERLKVYVSGLKRFSETEYLADQVNREMWQNLKTYPDQVAEAIVAETGITCSFDNPQIRAMGAFQQLQTSSPDFEMKAKKILEIMGIRPATEIGFHIEE